MEQEEYEALLDDTEAMLSRIKALYDQWFQGFERGEPVIPRKQFERAMLVLQKNVPRRTVMRFRYQTLVQRYTTMQAYWQRVGRQIEEGTYRRDLMRLREQNRRRHGLPPSETSQPQINLELRWDDLLNDAEEAVHAVIGHGARDKATPAHGMRALKPEESKTAKEVSEHSVGPDEKRLHEIYRAYVSAKKRNNESIDDVSFERVVRNINKIVPQVQRDKGAKRVDFNVVIKDGRVGLKPIIKDDDNK